MRTTATLLAGVAGIALLAGCGGGGSSNPLNPATTYGYFRFVNGSADDGAVDVYVDGKLLQSDVAYGQITAYNKFKPGAHTIAIDATGTQTAIAGLGSTVLSQSVNAGQYVSLVLTGEQHPTVTSDTPNLLAFTDQVYSTPTNGFAVDFHNAAAVTASGTTQLSVGSSTGTQNLGTGVAIGGETQPTGVPNTFVGTNTAVTFTATPSNSAIPPSTLTPSEIDPSGCSANTLPCNSGNLSIYYIDGPAASTSPSAPPGTGYPNGITATETAAMAAIFDANGT